MHQQYAWIVVKVAGVYWEEIIVPSRGFEFLKARNLQETPPKFPSAKTRSKLPGPRI